MPYSALPTPANNPLANLKTIAEDTVIYVSPSGNDSTGNGTLNLPFASLSRAMDAAREHIIVGKATLTIRLLKGNYTLDTTIDLYHPQGNNLIIEGDPAAFAQRIVSGVNNYQWSLAQISGGGMSFNARLWDGTTSGNPLLHGFSSTDNGGYFTITNGRLGARSEYGGDGISVSSPNSYNMLFHGDRFFNHGYSYEYAGAIMGIGRINSATTSTTEIGAWTHNMGYDGRCPAWDDGGGINNTQSWGGVLNNYPETQYASPVGYYGDPAWRSLNAPSAVYPAKGSEAYITNDPIILSTYPVVMNCSYRNNTGTLFLKNGNLKALRNILFINNGMPYAIQDGSTALASTVPGNVSKAISVFSKQTDPDQLNQVNRTYYEGNGTGLYLENANVGIRHLGFSGVGTAISAYGSKISKYSENTIDTIGGTEHITVLSNLGNLDNSPILCTSNCQYGILAKTSTIDFTDASGLNTDYRIDRRESSVHIGAKLKGVALYNSTMTTTAMSVQMAALVPNFKLRMTVPVFPGTTHSGNTSAFIRYATSIAEGISFWNAYPRAELYIQPNGLSDQRIGFLNYITPNTINPANIIAGVTASATNVLAAPTSYANYQLYGLMTAPAGLSFMRTEDIWNGICAGAGGTLSLRFYSDFAATTISSRFDVGKVGVRLQGQNGQQFGLQGLVAGSDSRQLHGAAFISEFLTYGSEGTYGEEYPNATASGVHVDSNSSLTVEKVLVVNNGGCPAVAVRNQSTLCIGQTQVFGSDPRNTRDGRTWLSVGSDPADLSGALCITGFAARALEIDSSSARIGSLFVKHPGALNPDPALTSEGNSLPQPTFAPLGRILSANNGSKVHLNNVFALTLPGHRDVYATNVAGSGLFSSRTARYGYNYARGSMSNTKVINASILADNSSTIIVGVNGRNTNFYAFHFDGGTADFSSIPAAVDSVGTPFRNMSFFAATDQSTILVSNVNDLDMNNTANNTPTTPAGGLPSAASNLLSGRFSYDRRIGNNRILATRCRNAPAQTTVYNTSGTTRPWLGPDNYTTAGNSDLGLPLPVTAGEKMLYFPINIGKYQISRSAAAGSGGIKEYTLLATTAVSTAILNAVFDQYSIIDKQGNQL